MFVYVHIYISIHTCMHACMRTYLHAYIHTYMHTYIHTYIHTCVCTCVCACICLHIHVYMFMCLLTSMYVASARWSLAIPIHALAFCSQFNINDLQNELPPLERPMLPAVVHTAMGIACVIYALVGTTGYMLLGARTVPNIL